MQATLCKKRPIECDEILRFRNFTLDTACIVEITDRVKHLHNNACPWCDAPENELEFPQSTGRLEISGPDIIVRDELR